jgi:RHS repeat-associated protein
MIQNTKSFGQALLAALALATTGSVGFASDPRYYVNDPLATTVAITDSAGEIAAMEADAFGAPLAIGDAPGRFTGKPYDADLGAYVFPFRNYRPEEGRWMSADPSGFPDGVNCKLYAPRSFSQLDPLGLSASDVTLYTYPTQIGIVQWMLLAENKTPAYSSYSYSTAASSMAAMHAVVHNRLSSPAQFGASGATSVIDIITASGQFAGFGKDSNGDVTVSTSIINRVEDMYNIAIVGTPGAYAQFINTAASVAEGGINDPFSGITEINGAAVLGGTYGWRTQGASAPGGRFVAIPSTMGGIIGGNQFYTLKE